METLKAALYSYKNNWIGTIVGGVAGYYIVKKGVKSENIYALIGGAILGATIGSTIQWKINAKISESKTKMEIEN